MLQARGLHKSYGAVAAVAGVSLDVRAGEIVGLVGNNGAGKTTLLKMLAGLVAPDGGTVAVDGRDPAHAAVRRVLGFLPEDAALYEHQTAFGYLRFFASLYGIGRRAADDRARVLLDRLRLDVPYRSRPLGQLSKGSAQKVAIARCLLHDPGLLLLDEPTGGLDPASRRDLDRFLRRLAQEGKAVVLSAHDLKQVETLCDRVVVMQGGRIALEGPLSRLREQLGGTVYTLHATVPFAGSTPEADVHRATFHDVAGLEAAVHAIAQAGGTVLELEGIPPSLDRILEATEAD